MITIILAAKAGRKEENTMAKKYIDVLIDGQVYSLGGSETDEYMQQVANYLNGKISQIKKQPGFLKMPEDYQNIMIYLNLADDYFKEKTSAMALASDKESMEKETYRLKHEMVSTQMKLENIRNERSVSEQELTAAKKSAKKALEEAETAKKDVQAQIDSAVREYKEQAENAKKEADEQIEAVKKAAMEQIEAVRREANEQVEAARREAGEEIEAAKKSVSEEVEATKKIAEEQIENAISAANSQIELLKIELSDVKGKLEDSEKQVDSLQSQCDLYKKRSSFPKRKGTVELKDAMLRL